MKTIFLLIAGLLAVSCGHRNLSDPIDANTVPAPLEQREEEDINRPDIYDENRVPAIQEERENEEKTIFRDDLYEDEGYLE